jgi:hypothetical protein
MRLTRILVLSSNRRGSMLRKDTDVLGLTCDMVDLNLGRLGPEKNKPTERDVER